MRCFSIFLLIALIISKQSHGYIGNNLYTILPSDLKPKDRLHETIQEQNFIIGNAYQYASSKDTLCIAELDKICESLKLRIPSLKLRQKVSVLISIGNYYNYFRYVGSRNGEWVPYFKQVISLTSSDTAYKQSWSLSYSSIANYYALNSDFETSIKYCFTALKYAKEISDSSMTRIAYGMLEVNYAQLGLYAYAVNYSNLSTQYITSNEYKSGEAENFIIDDYGFKVTLFLSQYGFDKKQIYLDSAWHYLNKIPTTGKNASWWRELYTYSASRYYFEIEDYRNALKYADTSLAIEDYYKDSHQIKQAIRGICLIKMGQEAIGKRILFQDSLLYLSPDLSIAGFSALYENAKKDHDFESALNYHELMTKFNDTLNLLKQRGRLFEVSSKFDVSQKQNEIDKLILVSKVEHNKKRLIILSTSLIIIALLLLVLFFYALSKKRALKVIQAEAELTGERDKLHKFLIETGERIYYERKNAVTEQRQKIAKDLHDGLSGTLAALKYYIGGMRIKSLAFEEQERLRNIEEEVNSVYVQARNYMYHLNDGLESESIDLTTFLRDLVAQFNQTTGLKIELNANEVEISEELDAMHQTQLYYILREAVSNALKHATATIIQITLDFKMGKCIFKIVDNGIGTHFPTMGSGLGIITMTERVEKMRGVP